MSHTKELTAEQIAANEATAKAEATAKLAADKAAAALEIAAKKAEATAKAKADKEAANAVVKEQKAAAKLLADEAKAKAKADKEAAAALVKAAKDAAAAEAAAKKAAEATTKVKIAAISQNGITRPAPDGACGKVWALADAISQRIGQPTPISLLSKETAAAGLNDATTRTQYARWKTFNSVFGPVPKYEAPAEAVAAVPVAEAA